MNVNSLWTVTGGSFVATLLLATHCGGAGDVGSACDSPASEEECVEGAVCDTVSSGDTICLQLCEDQEDCADDENCNGVSDGSDRKACHPKDQE